MPDGNESTLAMLEHNIRNKAMELSTQPDGSIDLTKESVAVHMLDLAMGGVHLVRKITGDLNQREIN